ncbi:MAG TPA: hypothetical protein DCE71_05470 [Parachlamydiales bacterium]|nr:hypothetical protein [Parachlamydiales bacterium]
MLLFQSLIEEIGIVQADKLFPYLGPLVQEKLQCLEAQPLSGLSILLVAPESVDTLWLRGSKRLDYRKRQDEIRFGKPKLKPRTQLSSLELMCSVNES